MARYLGHLPVGDPLYSYLQTEILTQLGYTNGPADFRVFRLSAQSAVYLYEETHSRLRVVGKFFAGPYQPGTPDTQRHLDREYAHLQLLRNYGFTGYPHHVVRPLGCNAALSSLLVEEYIPGPLLSRFFDAAIQQGARDALLARLTALAYFLATLHTRTATTAPVDFAADGRYLDHLAQQLLALRLLRAAEVQELAWLRDCWAAQPQMAADRQVLVHGDATPTNFLFGDGLQVIAIDLERMRQADRVFDVGRIAGELQHAFLLGTGDKYTAEPFIRHFLWEYACHFPDRERTFAAICGRVPFYMALTLLRIARNPWIPDAHRHRLVAEAKTTLWTF